MSLSPTDVSPWPFQAVLRAFCPSCTKHRRKSESLRTTGSSPEWMCGCVKAIFFGQRAPIVTRAHTLSQLELPLCVYCSSRPAHCIKVLEKLAVNLLASKGVVAVWVLTVTSTRARTIRNAVTVCNECQWHCKHSDFDHCPVPKLFEVNRLRAMQHAKPLEGEGLVESTLIFVAVCTCCLHGCK